jgi:protein ImuB
LATRHFQEHNDEKSLFGFSASKTRGEPAVLASLAKSAISGLHKCFMAFACIYVHEFMVQSVVRAEPALRERALALIGGMPPLWNVIAVNQAALRAGIQLGMTKSQAAEFCGVEIRQRSEAQEKATHAALLDVAWSVSPRVEDTAPDTMVLDLEGLSSLLGADETIAQELMQRTCRIGVFPHIAVASNIETAIHAARGFPGITIISAGEELDRLGDLPVHVLSAEVEVLEIFERWGVDTLRALAALPVLQLSERLGQQGVRLHQLARGAYQRSLVLAEPNLTFEEEMELDDSVEELEPLSFLLGRLLDQLCARLEARALAVRAVHVRFALEPSFEKDVQSLSDDSRIKTAPIEYAKTLTLPVAMRDSKMLLKLLRLLLQNDPPVAPIQKIILTADAAAPRMMQSGLFVPRGPDPEKLELTVARLAKLVGESNVGAPELLDTHRSDNFRMTKFVAPGMRAKSRKKNGASSDRDDRRERHGILTGFRIIRPALPVSVDLREERPKRVYFRGISGEVVAASGPWRRSGDWWQEESWDHDEWDLAVAFGSSLAHSSSGANAWPEYGVYCVYYDALRRSWFLRGFYD